MSQFTTPLKIEYIDEKTWRVLEPFEFHIGSYPSENIVEVPIDFITDFASIPRILWSIASPFGKYGKAAVVHDWFYRTPDCGYNRKEADKIFLEGMEILKVPKWKMYFIYHSVRTFGNLAWKKNRERI